MKLILSLLSIILLSSCSVKNPNNFELKNIGVKRVEICYRSFDPEYNKPMTLTGTDQEKYQTAKLAI